MTSWTPPPRWPAAADSAAPREIARLLIALAGNLVAPEASRRAGEAFE